MAAAKKKKAFTPYDPLKAKGYAERVKALLLERGTINEDISAVCDEAKEHGCEPALIRFAAREMMIDEAVRKERDEKRARYLHAVGLAVEAVQSGEMSARQAAKVYSIGKSSVYKEMAVRAVSTDREMIAADFELHDPATGEIIETKPEDGGENGKAEADDDATRVACGGETEGQQQRGFGLADGRSVQHEEPGDGADAGRGAQRLKHGVRGTAEVADAVRLTSETPAGVAPGPHDTDDLDALMPPHLRRPKPSRMEVG